MSRAQKAFRTLSFLSIISSFYYIENVTLRRVSQEAAIAAPAFTWKWSAQLISEGFMAIMFVSFAVSVATFVGAGLKRLAGIADAAPAPVPTSPSALEAGHGDAAAPVAPTASPSKSKSACAIVHKVLGAFACGFGFGCWLWTHRVISFQDRSFRENAGATLLTLFRGLGVLFAVFMGLATLGWIMRTCAQAKKARSAVAPQLPTTAVPAQVEADLIQFEEEKKLLGESESA